MNKKELRNLANKLTISRIILGLPIIVALNNNNLTIAWIIILIGGITDILDGWLARKADGGTSLGATIDPLADKVMLFAPLLWLSSTKLIPLWSIWLLITREIMITGWRSRELHGGPASKLGKAKTILQFVSILMMIWPDSLSILINTDLIRNIGLILYWPSLYIALYSGYKYMKINSEVHL
tara:strand:+ start:908 stop:1453 length:546 start_codon:yes stop_codon:yes gene_type:complete